MEEPRCSCEEQTLVFKNERSGPRTHKIYVYQCNQCGRRSKAVAANSLGYGTRVGAKEFDESLQAAWNAKRDAYWKSKRDEVQSEQQERQEEWEQTYHEHVTLMSPKWRALRELVFARAGGICEGCGKRRAVQVHHLTYDHLGDEFLWELRAVCRECHERVHAH